MQTVVITTAQELTADQRKEAKALAIAKAGTKEIELTEKVDSTIVGGVILQVGSRVYDASVRAQFAQLKS